MRKETRFDLNTAQGQAEAGIEFKPKKTQPEFTYSSSATKCDLCKGLIDTEHEKYVTIHIPALNIDANTHYACFLMDMKRQFDIALNQIGEKP